MTKKEYNYHDWAQFMVVSEAQRSTTHHFAAVMFETRVEWTPAYDRHDDPQSATVPMTTYFAFPDKDKLIKWVTAATLANKKFFFFEVKKLGVTTVKVDISTDV